jgi:uncharacterized membrane protein
MHLLETLASAFFNIFGITQPSERARSRATWFLFGMLLLVAVAVASGGYLLYHLIHVG